MGKAELRKLLNKSPTNTSKSDLVGQSWARGHLTKADPSLTRLHLRPSTQSVSKSLRDRNRLIDPPSGVDIASCPIVLSFGRVAAADSTTALSSNDRRMGLGPLSDSNREHFSARRLKKRHRQN